jgi:small conductance mechanosensitive channel
MLLSFEVDIHRIETFIGPVVTIVVAAVVAKFASLVIRGYIRRNSRILKTDPTNYSFLQNAVGLIVFLIAVFYVFWNIPQLHSVGKTLFAGAGILAAIVGFASQEAFSNIISGIFIVIYKPFGVGDTITLLSNKQGGVVEDITLRHTIINGAENRRIVVPNSVISREQIVNSSIKDNRIQLFLEVLIAYDSDHNRALAIMQEEALKHPLILIRKTDNDKFPNPLPVSASIIALEDKGVRLRAYVWAKNDGDAYSMKCDLLKTLKERFATEGITLSHTDNVFELKQATAKADATKKLE